MRDFLKTILSISLDGFVVLTMIATVGTIAALLPFADVHRRTTYIVCVFVAVIGFAAVAYQMRRLYKLERVRELLSSLLDEGHRVTLAIANQNPGRRIDYPNQTVKHQVQYNTLAAWCGRVENVLRLELAESYVTRFHLGGSNEQDAASMTIWKMNHRLETLAGFLVELGHK